MCPTATCQHSPVSLLLDWSPCSHLPLLPSGLPQPCLLFIPINPHWEVCYLCQKSLRILHFRFLTFQAGFLLSPTPTPHSNLISCCTHTYFTFLPPDLLAIPRIPCIFFVDLSADSPLYPIHLCLCSPPDYSGTRSSANCSNMFSSSPIQLCIATLALLTIC